MKTKKKLIILKNTNSSSSRKTKSSKRSTKSSKRSDNQSKREEPKKRKKKTIKKRRLLILELSTTPEIVTEKEKIENFFPEKEESNKDLKIEQTINKTDNMSVVKSGVRLNEKYIELMEKLSDIMVKQGEPFRARAYQKAQETIMAYPDDITSPSDLKGKPGIGATIMEKLEEYTKTGTLRILEREKNNPVNILGEVYGIGPKKAKELVDKGITSIEKLRENQNELNDVQKVGLKYYEDILKRIPRSEIEEYKNIFTKDFSTITGEESDAKFEIVGSYRRGAKSSGDIDVIITSNNPKVFINFIDLLVRQQIITEVLSRGPTKCLVIAKIPSSDAYRRVDFLYTSPEEYPFSVLYFTGSKIFNTVMRHQALQMGLTMNEHGLYTMKDKKKGEKVSHSFHSEKDIFDYLNMEYKSPEERIDGRAVVIKQTQKPQPQTSSHKQNLQEKPINIVEETVQTIPIPMLTPMPVEPKNKTLKKKETDKNVKKTKTKKMIIIDDENVVLEEQNNNKVQKKEENKDNFIEKQSLDPVTVQIINDFKKNGIKVLESLNEKQLSDIIRESNKAYYNEEPIMTDNEYDIVKEYIEKRYPQNIAIKSIGAPIERNKVTLPYQMWSMDKIKPDTNALTYWTSKYKGHYVLSCKFDGVSGLYTTEGDSPKLYTRGDGKVGQDVSHLIPYLRLPKTKNIVIRGEFIIPKKVFETKYKEKFANPRNMVAGIVNHKTLNEAVKDVDFVAYEVIKPVLKPSEQMATLSTLDVDVVLNKTVTKISNELLSETLVEWRNNYIYEIDGIIVTNDDIYERKSGNPEHAFAFNMVLSDQIAEAKVVDVIWTPSKDGYLKPRVQIEPINLGGVKIEYATGFNGAFINDNKVGIGATIELIRSGDVIPHIRKVIVPAENPKMPSVPYKWNDTHVDILLENIGSDETVKEKVITGFFRGIGVEGLSSGNVARIIQTGFDTVPKIIKMSVDDLLKVEGFKIKMATKIHDGIKSQLDKASLITIMSATNIFGRGFSDKKLELIMESYPNVLLSKETNKEKVTKVAAIKGMATKTAEAFVERIPEFLEFMKDADLMNKLNEDISSNKKEVDTSHPLYNKTIVITGFRDAKLQEDLKNVGAKIGSSVSKNTYIVLTKDKEDETGKVLEAKKLGI